MSAYISSTRFDKRDKLGTQLFKGRVFKIPTFEDVVTTILADVYGEDEEFPNVIYSVTGDAKTGKTHFAFTAPAPIRVYCFNRGADFVKRRFEDKQIDIVNFHLPVKDETDGKPWAELVWNAFYADFKKTVEESK
jgi:hypothetical protein